MNTYLKDLNLVFPFLAMFDSHCYYILLLEYLDNPLVNLIHVLMELTIYIYI